MKIGYARVSTTGQDYETQLAKLTAADCEKIFSEKQSGKNIDNRCELQKALEFAREGDILIVTKLDRLARSMGDLWGIVNTLESKGVAFKVLDQEGMDTSTATGKLLFNILGSIAEFERDLINARTAEGRKAAQEKGIKFGRPKKITEESKKAILSDVADGTLTMKAIGEKYGVTRDTIYKLVGSKSANQ